LQAIVPATSGAGGVTPEGLERLQADFVAAAAQDLLAPVSVLLGYAELLRDDAAGPLNPQQTEFVSQIEDYARMMQGRMDGLLTVARREALPTALNMRPLELPELCAEVVAALAPVARGAGVMLALGRDGGPAQAALDPRWMRQALGLLIERAIQSAPEGERVEVRTYRTDEVLRVEVTTSLAGFPCAMLDKLFGKRPGLTPALLRMNDGAGFGLYAARLLVEAHGGTIGHESGPGQRDVFCIALPAVSERIIPSQVTPEEPATFPQGAPQLRICT
jgi:signal transduction histidine kinase